MSRADALGRQADAVLTAALARLIPNDEFGPGALEAGVPAYIEGALERAGDVMRARWREALEAVDAFALAREGAVFATLPAAAQDGLLELLAAGEAGPASAAFAGELWQRAIEGMFCDPSWGGNAGEAGWRLLGYPGPRLIWSAANQRIAEIAPRP